MLPNNKTLSIGYTDNIIGAVMLHKTKVSFHIVSLDKSHLNYWDLNKSSLEKFFVCNSHNSRVFFEIFVHLRCLCQLFLTSEFLSLFAATSASSSPLSSSSLKLRRFDTRSGSGLITRLLGRGLACHSSSLHRLVSTAETAEMSDISIIY